MLWCLILLIYFFKRYFVIGRPLRLDQKPTRLRACVTCFLIWIYSVIFASIPLFGIGKYVPEGFLTSCSFDYLSDDWPTRIFIAIYFLGAWLLPMAIIMFSYVAIILAVIRVRENIVENPTTSNGQQQQSTPSTSFSSNMNNIRVRQHLRTNNTFIRNFGN